MPSIQQLCCYISLANNKEYYLSIESKWLGQERIKLTQIIFGAGDDIFTKKKSIHWSDFHINLQNWHEKEFPYVKDFNCQNTISLFPTILVNDKLLVTG